MPDVIKPYEGPPATPENFATAFPQVEQMAKKGLANLDDESKTNLLALMNRMRSTPPKPATVVNLHPWPLMFSYQNRLLRGIQIPACNPGQLFAHYYIRGWRKDWQYNENGALEFREILPIQIAGEFVREFSNKDNDGGGVLIYEGEHHPDKVDLVEMYDAKGRPVTRTEPGWDYDEENNRVPAARFVPERAKFQDLLQQAIRVRNEIYFQKVQAADRDYNLPNGRGKALITEKHRLMAEVLFAEGLIGKVPEWNLASRLEEGLSEKNCPACGVPVRQNAYKCRDCGNVLDIVAAFCDGYPIPEAKLDIATSDELEQIELIKLEREERRGKAAKQESTPVKPAKAK